MFTKSGLKLLCVIMELKITILLEQIKFYKKQTNNIFEELIKRFEFNTSCHDPPPWNFIVIEL